MYSLRRTHSLTHTHTQHVYPPNTQNSIQPHELHRGTRDQCVRCDCDSIAAASHLCLCSIAAYPSRAPLHIVNLQTYCTRRTLFTVYSALVCWYSRVRSAARDPVSIDRRANLLIDRSIRHSLTQSLLSSLFSGQSSSSQDRRSQCSSPVSPIILCTCIRIRILSNSHHRIIY